LHRVLDTRYEPVSSAARQAYIDGVPESGLPEIDQDQFSTLGAK
jgi:hypothetical protein